MSSERILVVDDNEMNLKLLRVLLMREQYDVRTAVDAEAALALVDSFAPQLILMDLQLPGTDGLTLTRRIKGDRRRKPPLVVAVTAFAMEGDETRAREAGCDGYVTKPYDVANLARLVKQLVT
ncbi:MAG TPA: response regulator [Myxococcales bacterium]|jgi:CheY-like chemotaxis protein|nr:response regulator [Myxococcales bacterium]